jgi:NitT/TauT family transport system substrate-binding protein
MGIALWTENDYSPKTITETTDRTALHPLTQGDTTMRNLKTTVTGLLALAIASLAPGASGQGAAKLEPVTISTSVETLDALVPQFGTKEGIYQKHGLDLKFVRGANGPAMVAAVVGGSADITHVSTALYFPAIEKGGDFRFLMGNYDIDYTLIGQKKLSWPNLSKGYPALGQDLKGRRIGVAGRGGATELFVRKILTDAGLNPDTDVTFIAVGTGFGAAGAFTNDQVDAMASIPPSDTLIGSDNFTRLVDIKTTHEKVYSPGYLFTVFAANTDFTTKRPQVAQAFCRATKETMSFIKNPANREKVVGFIATNMNLKPEQAAVVFDGYKGNFNAPLSKQRWDAMTRFSKFVPPWDKYVYEPCARISAE